MNCALTCVLLLSCWFFRLIKRSALWCPSDLLFSVSACVSRSTVDQTTSRGQPVPGRGPLVHGLSRAAQRTNTVSLPTRQMCDAWPRIPGVNFRRKMGTFFVVFQRGVRQIDIHVNPSPSDIDERKSMFINGDAVAIVY